LNLALLKKLQKKYLEKLALHQQKWFWMRNNYITVEVLPLSFFEERIEKMVKNSIEKIEEEIEKIKNSLDERKREKITLFKKYKPEKKLALYTEVTEVFADMQDIRKSFVIKMSHYHKLFLEQVSDHFSQPLDNLWYYSYREMVKAVETETFLPQSVIDERRKIIVAGEAKDEKIILTGKEANEMLDYLQHKVEDVTEFSGLVAHGGRVQGKVKIVLKVADVSKVADNDILVSSMTRPEMIVAMQKAAAYVTDEGGITCHAAIISRELNKPCIIGTKIATKVLHDGDMVEVDADNGVVRILK
jgi:phosphoenolpyruvate synthase/pyruvate phosphate dikinase